MGELLASVRMCWKFPPCVAEPVSDVFKKNMLLAEAGPIRNADNIFNILITYLRRKNIIGQMQLQPEKSRVRVCQSNSFADSKVSEEGEAQGAPHTAAGISLKPMVQPMVKPMVRQLYCSP